MSLVQSFAYKGDYDMDRGGAYSVFILDNPSPAAEIFGVMLKDYMELNNQKLASHNVKIYDNHSPSSQALTVHSFASDRSNSQSSNNLTKLLVTQIFKHGRRDTAILLDYVQQSSVVIILLSTDIIKSHMFIIELFYAIINRKAIVAIDIDGLGYSESMFESLYESFDDLAPSAIEFIENAVGSSIDQVAFAIKYSLPFITPKRFSYKDSRTVRNAFLHDIMEEILSPPPLRQLPIKSNNNNNNNDNKSKKQKLINNGKDMQSTLSNSDKLPIEVPKAVNQLSKTQIAETKPVQKAPLSSNQPPPATSNLEAHQQPPSTRSQQQAQQPQQQQVPAHASKSTNESAKQKSVGVSSSNEASQLRVEQTTKPAAKNLTAPSQQQPKNNVQVSQNHMKLDIVLLNPGLIFDQEVLEAIVFLEKSIRENQHDSVRVYCEIIFAATGGDESEKNQYIITGIGKINGIQSLFAKVFDKYPKSYPDIIVACLKTLRNLTMAQENKGKFDSLLSQISVAIINYSKDARVQSWGCDVVDNIISNLKRATDLSSSLFNAIAQILASKSSDSGAELHEKAFRIILRILDFGDYKTYLKQQHVIDAVLDSMNTYSKIASIQLLGCKVLAVKIGFEKNLKANSGDGRILEILIAGLNAHVLNPELVNSIVLNISNLIKMHEVNAIKLCKLNATDVLINTIKSYQADNDINILILQIFSNVLSIQENIPGFASQNFVKFIIALFFANNISKDAMSATFDILMQIFDYYALKEHPATNFLEFVSTTQLSLPGLANVFNLQGFKNVTLDLMKLILSLMLKSMTLEAKQKSKISLWSSRSILNQDYLNVVYSIERMESRQSYFKSIMDHTIKILNVLEFSILCDAFTNLNLESQTILFGKVSHFLSIAGNNVEAQEATNFILKLLLSLVAQAETISPAKHDAVFSSMKKSDIQNIFSYLEQQYKFLRCVLQSLLKSPTQHMLATSCKCVLVMLQHGNNEMRKNILSKIAIVNFVIQASLDSQPDDQFWALTSSVLCTLSNIPEFETVLVSTEFYKLSIEAMNRFPNSENIQQLGCSTLWNLSYNDANESALIKGNAINVLVKSIQIHKKNVHIQREGFAALSNFAANSRNIDTLVLEAGCLEKALLTIKDNLQSHLILREAGCVLWNLIGNSRARLIELRSKVSASKETSNGSQQEISSDEIMRDKYEIVAKEQSGDIGLCALQMMKTHPTDIEILKNSCGILRNSIDEMNEESKEYLSQEGVIRQILLASVAASTDQVLQYNSSYTLWSLSFKNPDKIKQILDYDGMKIIVNSLKQHMDDIEVQKRATSLIWNLVADEQSSTRSRQEALRNDIVNAVLNISMKRHPGNEEIQVGSCVILKYILADEAVRVTLLPELPKIVESTMQVMKNHVKHAFIQQYGSSILRLVFEPIKMDGDQVVYAYTTLNQDQKIDVAKLVISTIENHVTDHGVIRYLCIIIKNLSEFEDFKANLVDLNVADKLTKLSNSEIVSNDLKIKKLLRAALKSITSTGDINQKSARDDDMDISMNQSFVESLSEGFP